MIEPLEEVQTKPKSKGPPPAAVPITKKPNGPPKPVIKKNY